jgi:hypothetical protein
MVPSNITVTVPSNTTAIYGAQKHYSHLRYPVTLLPLMVPSNITAIYGAQ